MANGKVIETGMVKNLDIQPQEIKPIQIPYKTSLKKGIEYFLNVKAVLKTAEPLLEKNYTIAYNQFLLQKGSPLTPKKHHGEVMYKTIDNITEVSGANFRLTFDNKKGTF